jgi:hypothetical protein
MEGVKLRGAISVSTLDRKTTRFEANRSFIADMYASFSVRHPHGIV